MIDFRYFPDIFEDFVVKTRAKYDTMNGVEPVFKFGSYQDLINLTTIDSENANKKYPLVWLVWDSVENTQRWEHAQLYTISPRVFICTPRDDNDLPEYAYDNYFKAILYPIWIELEKQIFYHENTEGFIIDKCTVNEHLKWGENYANKIYDALSALEIKFSDLRIRKSCY